MKLNNSLNLTQKGSPLNVSGIHDISPLTLKDLLSPIQTEIISITHESEQAFLSIGSRLREFYLRSRGATRISADAARLFTGEEVTGPIGELRGILNSITDFQNRAKKMQESYAERLQKIQKLSGTLFEPIRVLHEIAKNLRILSLTTKIQNAKIGKSDARLDLLPGLVKQLTVTIDTKSMNILQRLKSLHTIIGRALTHIMKLESGNQGKLEEILRDAASLIDSLILKKDVSSQLVRDISLQSNKIADNIGEVVASIQFHDITRQQIEHVVETLTQLMANLASACSPAEKAEVIKEQDIMNEAARICGLQAGQLKNSKNELVQAVHRIIDNLGGIGHTLKSMLEDTRKVHGSSGTSGSFLEEMELDLATVSETLAMLSENVAIADQLSGTIKTIIEAAGEMTSFVEDMENIENEIEVIALNAAVKAGQIGQRGAGLGLIAGRIQQLSKDTHIPTSTISQVILSVTALSDELSKSIRSKSGRDGAVKNMLGNLESLRGSFHTLNGNIQSLFTQMEQESESIVAGLEDVVSGIRVHVSFASALDRAIAGMEAISDGAATDHIVRGSQGTTLIENIKGRYTMQRQRDIHKDHEVNDRERDDMNGSDSGVELPGARKKNEETFGDNIELF